MTKIPCLNPSDNNSVLALGGHKSVICYTIQEGEKKLIPDPNGSRFVTLLITIYGPKVNPPLNINSLAVADPGRQPGIIVGERSGPSTHEDGPTSQSVSSYSLELGSQVKAEPYRMRLEVSQSDKTDRLNFYLPMGAAGDWLELKEAQKSVECWSGNVCSTLNLLVGNKLPYTVEITQISVTSEPSDLLQPIASSSAAKLENRDSPPQPVAISLKANRLSFFRAMSGLRIPKANLTINYQDQYGRKFYKPVSLDLEVRPNLILLASMLLLGAVVGTIVRIDLTRLQKANVITRKQRLVFAGITFATGVLVCVVALFANLKLVVFADQNTYSTWDPKMLFLTSLIGTIGGIPILYARLKLPNPEGASTDGQQTANGRKNKNK